MRAAAWLLFLFGVAVALALVAGNNQGMVSVFWPPHRVDVSVNFAILLLVLAFLVLHLALGALSAIAALPAKARRWRRQRRESLAHAALLEALAQLLAGRFLRARKAAQSVIELAAASPVLAAQGEDDFSPPDGKQLALAHVIAAESAHALRDRNDRDEHLRSALATNDKGPLRLTSDSTVQEGVRIRAARWALDDREPERALELIDALPPGAARRTLALRVRLKAARHARRPLEAMDTARALARHGGLSADASASILRSLAIEVLNDAHDTEQLERQWLRLDAGERVQPELAAHAAQRLLVLRGNPAQARAWLWPVWQRVAAGDLSLSSNARARFMRALEDCMDASDAQWLASIEAAQTRRPGEATLQYLAGVTFMRRALWGKAQQALLQATQGLQDQELRRRAWRALAQLAEQRGDQHAAQAAWQQAGSV